MERNDNQNAVNYVINLVTSILSGAEIIASKKDPLNYRFYITTHDLEIGFGRDTMEDFQVAIEKYRNSDQYRSLEGFIKFRVYVNLGKAGFIPKFIISKELLDEKRDWLQQCNIKFERQTKLYEVFYQGLKNLSSFLTNLIKQYRVAPEEIKTELEDIHSLIEYYDKNRHFTDKGVSVNSLGYFKAAAVCIILNKENEKRSISVPRIIKAIDQEIYLIVSELRENPFPQIKMPVCIYDYAEHLKGSPAVTEKSKTPDNELVFIACGQLTEREKILGIKIKSLLTEKGINSFLAETANDLESLNSHIFNNLGNCTGFIAILHKRDGGKHDTSVWINQEIGIAAFLRSTGRTLPSLVLYEDGLNPEGLIKYTIANPPKFKSDEEAIARIEEWIKYQNFKHSEKLPEIDIILNEDRKQFGSSAGGGRNGYYGIGYALSFRIRNKSDVNVCLENIRIENEILGESRLDKTNPRITKLPLNIGPRMTEEVNLMNVFPNEVVADKKNSDFKLGVAFEFADRIITKELAGYL